MAIGLEGGGGDRVGQLGVVAVGVRWVFSLGLKSWRSGSREVLVIGSECERVLAIGKGDRVRLHGGRIAANGSH